MTYIDFIKKYLANGGELSFDCARCPLREECRKEEEENPGVMSCAEFIVKKTKGAV